MNPTPYVAWLRVYEPLDAFPSQQRDVFEKINFAEETPFKEQIASLRRLVGGQLSFNGSDGAYVIVKNGKKFVSPWSTLPRCWISFNEFKSSLPEAILPFFIPEIESFEDQLQLSLIENVPHILSATWMIPPRWFALFEPKDRITGINSSGAFTLMRTEIIKARIKCKNAHEIVKKAFGTGPVEQEIEELSNWLENFHPESILECDYGGLANYLHNSLMEVNEGGIDFDSSIEDVQESLEGLAIGDGVKAGEGYSRVISRWRRVATLEQAS